MRNTHGSDKMQALPSGKRTAPAAQGQLLCSALPCEKVPARAAGAGRLLLRHAAICAAVLLTAGSLFAGCATAAKRTAERPTDASAAPTAGTGPAEQADSPEDLIPPADTERREYNAYDCRKLAAFFDQTDAQGVSNGKKLDSRYDSRDITDAAKALGAVWMAQEDGELHLVSLKYYQNSYVQVIPSKPRFAGSLDLSGCTTLREVQLYYDFPGLRVDGCAALQRLVCVHTPMTELEVRDCPALEEIQVEFSALHSFRMEGCPAVLMIDLGQNRLDDFSVRGAEKVRSLWLQDNALSAPDLSGMPQLTELVLSRNPLTSLDLTPCLHLKTLGVSGEGLHAMDLSPCGELTHLYCRSLGITELDLKPCPKLHRLELHDDRSLTRLDLSGSVNLVWAELGMLPITELDLSACKSLTHLDVQLTGITALDLSNLKGLHSLKLLSNPLHSVDLTGCDQLGFYGIRAEGNGTVDLTLTYSTRRRGSQVGPVTAAVDAAAFPGEGQAFQGWLDRSGKPLYPNLREKQRIRIESDGAFDGLVAVFGP